MKHTGWKSKSKVNEQILRSHRHVFWLILLLVSGFLLAFPDVASAIENGKFGVISLSSISDPVSRLSSRNDLRVLKVEGDGAAGRLGNRSDREIKERIIEEITKNPFIQTEDLSVVVENGIATLKGTVGNLTEKAAATADAFQGGARKVRNQLKVRDSPVVSRSK